jgi:diguanylate cyclase (GGDEF)-like protein/PAS domain S-box-containing protein
VRTYSIRAHLLLLALAISLPLAGLLILSIYSDMQQAIARAKTSQRMLAAMMVSNTGGKIAEAHRFLERLANRPFIRQVDPDHCDPILKEFLTMRPEYANIGYSNMAGDVICSALPKPGGKPVNIGKASWFRTFLKARHFVVGEPFLGPITGKWVSVLSEPIWNERREMIGAVHLPLDLAAYDPSIPTALLSPESRYGFFSEDGTMIWRNKDPQHLIGTRPKADAAQQIVRVHDGEFESVAKDGVRRYFAVISMPEIGWVAYVGVPSSQIYSVARQRAMTATGTVLATIGVLVILAMAFARRIDRPAAELERVARAVEGGDLAVRAAAGGPREMAAVAQRLNAMIAAQQHNDEQLRAFLENSAVIAWLKDELGRYVFASQNYLRRFDFTQDAVVGHTAHHIWPQTIADAIQRNDQALLEHGTAFEVVEALPNPDGSISWWLSNKFIFQGSDGQRLLGGLAVDITERKESEAELRVAAVAFESQEGMMITDADNLILKVNRAFTEISGYTTEEIVGQPPAILKSGRHDQPFYAQMWQSLNATGSWQGEVWNRRKNGEVHPEWLTISVVKGDDGRVINYVATHNDITARKNAEEAIRHLAFYDPLTKLPNRRLVLDRLAHALASTERSGHHDALLFIDLDNFKTLNDTLGHDKGDMLLIQVAERLSESVRESDTVARLGGDEFLVILEGLSTTSVEAYVQAETVATKILTALNHQYLIAGHLHHSTPSIGVTVFSGHQNTVEVLLRQADLAMYQAKTAGRNTVRFFDPKMQAMVTDRADLEVDLREAIRQQQFELHYQPQVVGDGRVIGAEALLRWLHPQRGHVSPGDFIPLAEETGLILPLGHWVLETACRQLATWATQPNTAHLTLAVNVSANQLHHPAFVDQVMAILDQSGANPHRLKLELTESLLVSKVEETIAKMAALKAKGVGFSLDDFGTGYSSLSYLKRLPLDQLKIDQGFVRDVLIDPNDAAIAKMVIALAESLGLSVIAEGVELESQRDFLARQGCHAYQGYLFSRPLPLAEFEQFLTRSSAATGA